MEPIRVLYVTGGIMHRGGIEEFMMNYYRYIDKSLVQIDFIVHGYGKGIYDDEIKSMGGKIYNVPVKSKNFFGNILAMKKIFNSGKYKIVHSHMDAMGMVVLKLAKKCGIPIRIAHSHNTQHLTKSRIKYFINEYARKNIVKYATHYFACSELAARWLYGNEIVNSNRVVYVKNAIYINKYIFDKNVREQVRMKYKLGDSFVIGHVGRFDYQKNHIFLLEVFSEVLKEIPNSKLVLVGDGHLRNSIENKIKSLNISDKVVLTGVRDDVNLLMNGFDVFCFPSLFEGLGIVLIEAQANGLNCVASSGVPREANIQGNVRYLKLSDHYKTWADSLISFNTNNLNRNILAEKFVEKSYSIELEAKKLQNIYLSLIGVRM